MTRPVSVPTTLELPRDGTTLRGWLLHPDAGRALLYLGGNGERVEDRLGDLERWFPRHAVHVLAYRGYGASDGSPSEDALVADAVALFDLASPDGRPVDVIGRSLGSGVAVRLAVRRPVERLALVTPFDSVAAVAHDTVRLLPRWFPLTDRFDSLGVADDLTCPVLVVRAEQDEMIRAPRTARLVAALGERAQEVVLIGRGHNDVQDDPSYGATLRSFLAGPPPDVIRSEP
jgi:pimeloyl-ACP methyl ester carboxylesterase